MISKRLMGLTVGLGMVLASAAVADGRGPGQSGPGGRPGPSVEAARRPAKDRLCVHLCKDDARVCTATAHAAQRVCRIDNCGAAIEAARTACEADPTSTECTEARAAARECQRDCHADFRTAMVECGAAAKDCIALCPDAGSTPPKDPACVATCRTDLQACLTTVRTNAETCRDECGALVDAARTACAADLGSTACKDARAAASACLQPCYETQRTEHAACDQAAGTCVQACPAAPTPTVAASGS